MNKSIFIPLAVSIILASCGEEPKKVENPNAMKISGHIDNPVDSLVFFRYNENIDTAIIDAKGNFSTELEFTELTEGKFFHGHEYGSMFFNKGFDVSISLNPDQFDESLKFSGKGAGLSNYAVGKLLELEQMDLDAQKAMYSLSPEVFTKKVDADKKSELDKIAKSSEGIDAGNSIVSNLNSNVEYDWLYKKFEYPAFHKMFAQDTLELDSSYYDFMKDVNLNDESLVDNESYQVFLWSVANRYSADWEVKEEGLEGAQLYSYIKNNFSGKVRSALLQKVINGSVNYRPFDEITGKMLEDYQAIATDKKAAETSLKDFQAWQNIKPGMDAPIFAYEDINGNMVSLEDYKGKLVYIDVWATWCGPCKYELPYLKNLVDDFTGNDKVVFIQVSVDKEKDKETWKNMVTEKGINAVQLFANGWDEKIADAYNINGIPRFMLINQEGKIINAKAPRPSSGTEIVNLINDHLK